MCHNYLLYSAISAIVSVKGSIFTYIENVSFPPLSSDSCGIPASVISNVTSVPFAAKVKAVMVDFCSVGASLEVRREVFISPPNVYMSSTGLVPGITGGYNARWCQRAL